MKTDALSRRLRFAPRNPEIRPRGVPQRITITPADLLVFEAIHRHGPLPTPYLFEFQKTLRRGYRSFQYRLRDLFHGDEDGPFLVRPQQQFQAVNAQCRHLVYELAPRARGLLAERGLAPYGRNDPFLHQLMQACVGASLELHAPSKGLRYIPREEVLARNAKTLAVGVLAAKDTLIPDDLFLLEGRDEKGVWYRAFAVEIDRNTESIERKNLDQNSFGRKVGHYMALLSDREALQRAWGIPGVTVLTVTTNATHAANMIEYVRKQNRPELARHFAFTVTPQFGTMWEVPSTVLFHLLDKPWITSRGEKDITKP